MTTEDKWSQDFVSPDLHSLQERDSLTRVGNHHIRKVSTNRNIVRECRLRVQVVMR